jgi:hypothetical protein
LDIIDFSDFFDFQADVPPEINDLRNPGFGLWFALSSSKGKRTGSSQSFGEPQGSLREERDHGEFR